MKGFCVFTLDWAYLSILAGLLGLACSVDQPVSGPIWLTGEWATIDPPEALRVAGRHEQKFCLQLIGTISEVDFVNGRVRANGEWHMLEGEAVDSEQEEYALQVAEQGGDTVCLYRAGMLSRGPDFPADLTMIKLRLRITPPLQVRQIRWHSYDPH